MNGAHLLTKKEASCTRSSQAVSHPSTIRAQGCLTSVIGRELVCSTWYGRWREIVQKVPLINARFAAHDSEKQTL